MPIYQDEDQIVTTDFGGGRSLAITLKTSAHSVEISRRFVAVQRQIQSVQKQIEYLREKQEVAGITTEEFDRLAAQIAEWEAKPDMFDAVVGFIEKTGEAWDNYANKAAEERGEPLPFTAENIGTIHLSRLIKVFNNLGRALGILEAEEKKALPTKSENSPEQSTLRDTEPQSTQSGIPNSTMTAPSQNDSTSAS